MIMKWNKHALNRKQHKICPALWLWTFITIYHALLIKHFVKTVMIITTTWTSCSLPCWSIYTILHCSASLWWVMLLQKPSTPLKSLKAVYIFLSYLSILSDHDVITVAVPNPQNISSYTVACTRQCELLDGLIQFIPVGKKDTISLCLLLHLEQCTVQIGQSPKIWMH